MNENKLLLITPTLGQSAYLRATVEGVAALSLPVIHVLCCPGNRVSSLQAEFPMCRVVEDAGRAGAIYGALNAALAAVPDGWDWFTYINDDDLLSPGFAEVFRRHVAQKAPEPVTYGNVRIIGENGQTISHLTLERNPSFLPAILRAGISPLNQQGMLFHRTVVMALGGFDTQYKICADLHFWARALAAGQGFRYYPIEVAQFRLRSGQISADVDLMKREQTEIAQRLFPTVTAFQSRLAKWRFRCLNLPRYIARSRNVGVATSYSLFADGKST